jgi:hypothetical protein
MIREERRCKREHLKTETTGRRTGDEMQMDTMLKIEMRDGEEARAAAELQYASSSV